MAFLTDNNWYQVIFRQTNDAAWGALSSFPGIPAALLADIVAGNAVTLYVTNAAAGSFSFYGGGAANFDDSVLLSSPAPETKLVTIGDDGSTLESMVDVVTGDWYTYDGSVRKYSISEANALKAFLP